MKKVRSILCGALLLTSVCSCGVLYESGFEDIPAGQQIELTSETANKYLMLGTNVKPVKQDDGSNLFYAIHFLYACQGYEVMTYFNAFVTIEVKVNIIGITPDVETLTFTESLNLDNNGDASKEGYFTYRDGETFRSFELVGYKYTYGGKCVKKNIN